MTLHECLLLVAPPSTFSAVEWELYRTLSILFVVPPSTLFVY